MKTIKVSDVYNVTQISKTNNEAWEKLIKIANKETDDVQFDFKDIHLEEPWLNEVFKKFMGNPRVHIKVYSSEKVKDTIDLMCKMGNIKDGRVINEDEMIEEVAVTRDIVLENQTQRFKDNIDIVKGVGMLDATEVVSQIGDFKTVQALELAIEQFSEVTGVKLFAVNTESIFIQVNIIELIAKTIGRLQSKGITLKILSQEADVVGKISLYQCVADTMKLSSKERAKIFSETLLPYTVGMLSRFKDTKKLDEFGRKGEGKPISCRVAIYKGMEETNGEVYLKFTTFNGNYFYTKLHYELDHDGEQLNSLVTESIKIPIQSVGLCDKLVGVLYHFNLPIQYNPEDYISSYKTDDDGNIIEQKMLLPEHIKMVLDDFNIKHNSIWLIHAITETKRYLDKCRDNK